MELRSIGILVSCLAVLTFCVVKAMEKASRYISNGTFNSMGWYIYVLIFIVLVIGVVLIVNVKEERP
ncbi:hypothetical protein FGG79_02940 [Bacillus sp. BHET2]|uniref:hypothetical protein n=1 Tax=Bacillus sp. BHET2 TaxID=2583818 RepID=UPI00110DABEE|nr:hypothetical protein [Bacillus sp. BHET2]TMU87111.1 hypothetical protein FGG79_02940 [Bacillus sp. BHET2]